MKFKPRLSILIPTFNRSALLKQTLDTVLAQGSLLQSVEVIISNDCSKDDTRDVVENFKREHPDLKIHSFHHEKNLGGPGNWSFLLNQAEGEYVYLLSDDDWIAHDFLKNYFEVLDRYPGIDMVYSAFEFRDGNMQLLEVSTLNSAPGLMSGPERLKNQLRANHMVMSTVYRAETLRAAGGWQTRYGMHLDSGAFSRTALVSKQTYFINKPLFFFRIGAETWSTFKVEKQKQHYLWYRLVIEDLISESKSSHPELVPFLESAHALHAQGVLNTLDIKCAHGTLRRGQLAKLLFDLAQVNMSVFSLMSFYKLALVSAFGYGWLRALRRLLNKPDIRNSSVFERSGG